MKHQREAVKPGHLSKNDALDHVAKPGNREAKSRSARRHFVIAKLKPVELGWNRESQK